MPEIPQAAIDAAEATSSRRALRGDEETARYKERLRVVLEAAYPHIEQAIRNEERVKVLRQMRSPEVSSAVQDALREETDLLDSEGNPMEEFDLVAGVAIHAALATFDQESDSRPTKAQFAEKLNGLRVVANAHYYGGETERIQQVNDEIDAIEAAFCVR